MVCLSTRPGTERLIRVGARVAGRLATNWYAVYVDRPDDDKGHGDPEAYQRLEEYQRMARDLGAQVVTLHDKNVSDALIRFAQQESISHVIFGQSARSRLDILLRGSVLNRFLAEVRDVTVQVVPMQKAATKNRGYPAQSLIRCSPKKTSPTRRTLALGRVAVLAVHIHRQIFKVIDQLFEIFRLDLRERERHSVAAESLVKLVVRLLRNQAASRTPARSNCIGTRTFTVVGPFIPVIDSSASTSTRRYFARVARSPGDCCPFALLFGGSARRVWCIRLKRGKQPLGFVRSDLSRSQHLQNLATDSRS